MKKLILAGLLVMGALTFAQGSMDHHRYNNSGRQSRHEKNHDKMMKTMKGDMRMSDCCRYSR